MGDRIDLSTFEQTIDKMIATNSSSYDSGFSSFFRIRTRNVKNYTKEEVEDIIENGDLQRQRQLSRDFFYKDGFYKRILLHYATLLNYTGILIPNPAYGKNLTTNYISKRYHNAINFIDSISLPSFFTNCAIRTFIYGSYYGVILKLNKNTFSVLDLPTDYCQTRFKDYLGNDIIEFNVIYFDRILDEEAKQSALSTYPKIISNHYNKYKSGKTSDSWIMIPTDIGICFPVFEETPLFLSTIPATIEYEQSVETEREKDKDEIKKIIVQKIPHYGNDGALLFEPDEAEVMHKGAVGMLGKDKNISVLTTYADVDAITSKTVDATNTTLEKMMNNIYYQTGASSQLFSATGNLALDSSIKNDLSLVMILAHKFEKFVTNIVNRIYSNSNINFKYTILPITRYNEKDYIDNAFKLASGGYSLLLPMLALGFSQKDISNIKDLENNVLNLTDKLIPLKSSYTQSGNQSNNEGGAPKKELEKVTEKTIENQVSLG